MQNDTQYIQDMARLVAARTVGRALSGDEERRLAQWLNESADNRALYKRMVNGEAVGQLLDAEQQRYGEKMAAAFGRPPRRRRQWYILLGSAAAAAAAVAALFVLPHPAPAPVLQQTAAHRVAPGRVHAVLTLADGRSVEITGAEGEHGQTDKSQEVYNALGTAGAAAAADTPAPGYHTLTVPAGGEFLFTLPDRSKVWLNAETELRFPQVFAGAERRVYLKGEAFFEVAHDRRQAFVISLGAGDITVYGTRFNVTGYDRAPMSAVLVEGSIGFVAASGKSVKLRPSQRMVYETATDELSVETVDTEPYTAWAGKMFIFRGQRLDEIMTTLARWYQVEVVFDSEATKAIRLSGQLYRYADIGELLKTYEEAGRIAFRMEGKTIFIYEL